MGCQVLTEVCRQVAPWQVGGVSGSHRLDGSQRSAIGIGSRANRPRRPAPTHQRRKTRLHSLLKESERDDLSKRPGRRRPCHYAQPRGDSRIAPTGARRGMPGSSTRANERRALSWGQAPALHFSLATLGCRCSGDGGWCRRPAPESIPDRSPGHAFAPIAHAGRRRHAKV